MVNWHKKAVESLQGYSPAVGRLVWGQEVVGSIPTTLKFLLRDSAEAACLAHNQEVGGSNPSPSPATNLLIKRGNIMKDTFKKVYTEMPDQIKKQIFDMKSQAEELKLFLDGVSSREMSIAQTNLEQALMWATKAWVLVGDEINKENEQKLK